MYSKGKEEARSKRQDGLISSSCFFIEPIWYLCTRYVILATGVRKTESEVRRFS
ncbi:MAG: hypothetical protein F6K07_05830 [Okeania sp. SIO1H5]|uniref:hypothetical protein n=1 Tax=Okeania sp. SIO1F9 TaxID=2607813 RepID=UPI0013BDF360|nr:hypothetical protein [Okeania sp. SIO1F9]NET18889.1 hypothetical protein [Okeania sp. SIO1H5]NET76385.1 hypothetical protein [Okeania sp. SIO1F9]NET93402.1 hypothetical protein [Okeania sp. SIO1H2]